MKIGTLQLDLISDGSLWLDGGAMFGVVPKPLWEKDTPSDSKNRVHLGLNCLLIRSPEKTIVIDTGCGNKYNPKQLEIYNIEQGKGLLGGLAACDVDPEDVDILHDLVIAAVNEGMQKAQDMANEKMGALTGGLNIPGLT